MGLMSNAKKVPIGLISYLLSPISYLPMANARLLLLQLQDIAGLAVEFVAEGFKR